MNKCHCGREIYTYPAGALQATEFTRGLCKECDLTRCDTFPSTCPYEGVDND